MKIDNEFTVSAPVERAWVALTDLEGLAPCMPGAQLTGVEPGPDGDVYSGKVKVKVGPVISQFAGTARFVERDEADRHAVVSAKGKDARGGGNASAVIDMRLRPDGADRTAVAVSTDLSITGRLAQFGSGMIKEISEKLLQQFVSNLEEKLHSPEETAPEAAAPAPAPEPAPEPAPAVPEAAPVRDSVPAPATTPAPTPAPVTSAPSGSSPRAEAEREDDSAPLDLMGLAGASVYKRLIPVGVAALVVAAVVVFLVVR